MQRNPGSVTFAIQQGLENHTQNFSVETLRYYVWIVSFLHLLLLTVSINFVVQPRCPLFDLSLPIRYVAVTR